jgi:hypothetical protein
MASAPVICPAASNEGIKGEELSHPERRLDDFLDGPEN